MIPYAPAKAATHIPVIDLTRSFAADRAARQAVGWEIHKACRETGFFYVSHHGIPADLMAAQLDWTARFFALPAAAKQALDFSGSARRLGYEAPLQQVLDAGSPPDLKESYMYAAPAAADVPNQWPAGLDGFRPQMQAYHTAIGGLGRHLVRAIALSLDLDEDFFDAPFRDTPFSVRLLHYPPQADVSANQLGAGAHTDWGGVTMLLQDDCGGLEVMNTDGEWIRARPIPGTFVINLGDMLRRWTNDIYRSTLHRVVNAAVGRDRYSVATFFSPWPDTLVSVLPSCCQDRPARYAPITAREHMAEMVRQTYPDRGGPSLVSDR